jgi:hypothetical protein
MGRIQADYHEEWNESASPYVTKTRHVKGLQTEQQLEATACGWNVIPLWVFYSDGGELLGQQNRLSVSSMAY